MNNDQINAQIQEIRDQMKNLQTSFDEMSQNFYKNNFTSHQDFTKSSTFTSSLKVPSYTTLPTCQVGEICESSGKLYICSATNTWTVVGTQS